MIKKYFKKIMLAGITITSLMAMSPISAYASYGMYDVNGNIIRNYHFTGYQILDGSGNAIRNKWVRDWSYDDKNNVTLRNAWYYANSNGYIATGWNYIDGKWYYFEEGNDSDSHGLMYQNCYTPDGYWVGSDGAWA